MRFAPTSSTKQRNNYTRARELLLEALTQAGLEKTKFELHSLRSGGVSEAAYNCIPERLLKAHGRWKSVLLLYQNLMM
jgi:hypothetical protein